MSVGPPESTGDQLDSEPSTVPDVAAEVKPSKPMAVILSPLADRFWIVTVSVLVPASNPIVTVAHVSKSVPPHTLVYVPGLMAHALLATAASSAAAAPAPRISCFICVPLRWNSEGCLVSQRYRLARMWR